MFVMTGVIVHEWIERFGGAENVLDELATMFPDAPVHVAWDNSHGRLPPARVHEAWLAKSPLRGKKAASLFLFPQLFRDLRIPDAEWLLCSSHMFAHHARVRDASGREVPKYVYAHTPARYIWSPDLDARGSSPAVRVVAPVFRALDRHRAKEPQAIAANSNFVARRIEQAWNRECTVIHPPVDIDAYRDSSEEGLTAGDLELLDSLPPAFLLGASRFVPYKRLDRVIAAGEVSRRPVVLAGFGPEEARLRALAAAARVPVRLVIAPSRPLLRELMHRSRALVFLAVEDFGILPIEAMAAGTPVVGFAEGGITETVVDGESGVLVKSLREDDLADAVSRAIGLNRQLIKRHADRFAPARFRTEVTAWMYSAAG